MPRRHLPAAFLLAASMSVAASAGAASSASFDFNIDEGVGYAHVFGGNLNVRLEPADYDTLKDHGINFVRIDLYIDRFVPPVMCGGTYTTSILGYKTNACGIADPANWNWNLPGDWT